MPTLLHLDSAANRSGVSVTRRLGARFAARWVEHHGPASHLHRDLTTDPVAPIGTGFCELGRRVERLPPMALDAVAECATDDAMRREWDLSRPLIDQVLAADVVLVGAPMYNFGVAASLKAWIDRITFPGAFREPSDGTDRLAATEVVVVGACGGGYGPGTPRHDWDFHAPYLRAYFASIGIPDERIHLVRAELTVAPLLGHLADLVPVAEESLARAERALDDLVEALVPLPASAV